jgi:hypothetical protein
MRLQHGDKLELSARRAIKSFDQTFSKVWPPAGPPEALSILVLVLLVGWFSITLAAGTVTVEPNGVVTPGTTLTIRIQLTGGNRAVEIEIAGSETAGAAEKILVARTPVADGNTQRPFIDRDPAKERIEIELRLPLDIPAGIYVFRVFPGKGRLPDSAVIEVENRPAGFLAWVKETVRDWKEMINDTPATSGYFKGETVRTPACGDLFLLDSRTYEVTARLTETGDCLQPAWAPDGKKLVYIRWLNEAGQPWLLDLEKEKEKPAVPRRLMKDFNGSVTKPLWSPDGKHIAFLSGERLWIMKMEGETARQVTGCEGVQQILAWTRDGKQVIFAAKPGEGSDILVGPGELLSLDGPDINSEDKAAMGIWQVEIPQGTEGKEGKLHRQVYDVLWGWLPYLSPDGTRLMFSLPMQPEGYMLWTRTGKDFTRAEMRREGFDPAWALEGDRIVFVSMGKK